MNDQPDNLKVYLLCRYALESSLYSSWINELPVETVVVNDCPSDFSPPADCGLIVTHEHYRWEEGSALRRIYEQQQIPILILADGILEYRNTWDNPTIPDGSVYQPVMGHKIACIGSSSARLIEAWGNVGKAEIVGLPRLDALLDQREPIAANTPATILVATATTPAFTDQQRAAVVQSLLDLKDHFDDQSAKRSANVVWRLTDGLDQEIGVEQTEQDQQTMLDAINSAQAVITTPSTIYLESALLGRPTAILDYSNSPQLNQVAWSITAAQQISSCVEELLTPPEPKLWFQDFCLRDSLACDSPAGPRLVDLAMQMLDTARDQRQNHQTISFPANMLAAPQPSIRPLPPDTSEIEISEQETQRIQLELNQAVHRLGTVPRELADKNNQISQLQSALDESRRRVADVRARLFKLRKILGIGKENQNEDVMPD